MGCGFGVWGSRSGVWGLGPGDWRLGVGVWGVGCGVWGLEFGVELQSVSGVWGSVFRISEFKIGLGVKGYG